MLFEQGRAQCQFDELSVDTTPNRILLATCQRLIQTTGLDSRLRDELLHLTKALDGITIIRLDKRAFRTVQLHSNNRFYRFLISLCELILESSIACETHGVYRFRDVVRDPKGMAALFEAFLYNFYRIECKQATVSRGNIDWCAVSEDDPSLVYLPLMRTDIVFKRPGRTLVIEAKYYQQTLQSYYDSETVHSGNLYQLFSYLKNLEVRAGQDAHAEGMLLYPLVQKPLRLRYEISGHIVRICTVDLNGKWSDIRQELLELVN
jgi:5-methylcytosine-specific restriction enzyme subunit McrC